MTVSSSSSVDSLCVVAVASIDPQSPMVELEAAREGGVDVLFATVGDLENTTQTVQHMSRLLRALDEPAHKAGLVTSVEGLRQKTQNGQTGVVFHFQGSDPLVGSVELLEAFYYLGLRVMQPTYNYRTFAGDGCCEPIDGGLSVFGEKLVKEANRLRIILDVSHVGERTSLGILEKSERPVIASHSNARALCDSPRNLSDDVIRAIAASGGVIGLCAYRTFVSDDPLPTVHDIARHAAYIAELTGSEHLGLGWDFATCSEEEYDRCGYDERYYPRPPWTWPTGLEWWQETPNIVPALKEVGFSSAEIDGVLGGNFLRVMTEVWGM